MLPGVVRVGPSQAVSVCRIAALYALFDLHSQITPEDLEAAAALAPEPQPG